MKHASRLGLIVFTTLIPLFLTAAVRAEESYFDLAVDQLTLTEGVLPKADPNTPWHPSSPIDKFKNRVVIDGLGEAYPKDQSYLYSPEAQNPHIVIHTPDHRDITGRLYVENKDATGLVELKFKVLATESKPEAKIPFYQAMNNYYEHLLSDGDAGGAWFRYRARIASQALGRNANDPNQFNNWRPVQSLDDTFSLFSGNQALAENLQLEKALPPASTRPEELTENVDLLKGITVAAMKWDDLIAGKTPTLDPLAAAIPADQHAIFFRDFNSLLTLADEADRNGTPVLQMAETRSQDANTRMRYEKQLGLSLSELGRLLGPQLINSVAITGSDPYLRGGSDIAILFQPKMGDALKTLLGAQIAAARKLNADAKDDNGKIGSVSYTGVRTPDRSLCSYLAVLNSGTVVITNSTAQLARLAAVQDGKADPLSKAPEYIFFRDRYKIDDPDESALLVLSDATIRRWCSARWRIGDSRRTRAAAVLADLTVEHLDMWGRGIKELPRLTPQYQVPNLGNTTMTTGGFTSEGYGSLEFLTPISELNIDKVTNAEAGAYIRWRDTYETNWRGVFDPIALRFQVSPKKLAADLTIMPLIASSEYRGVIDFAKGAKIAADAGDPHETIFRAGISININSDEVKSASSTVSSFAPSIKVDPFSWVGQSLWFYADNDPFWKELAAAKDPDKFMEKNFVRSPLGLRVEVSDGFKLAAFLVAVHAFVDQSAPGMTNWENLNYKDEPYVKITPSENAKKNTTEIQELAIYYRASGDGFLLTLNEAVLKSAIDREIERDTATKAGKVLPTTQPSHLGENLVLQGTASWLNFLDHVGSKQYQTMMQERSWSNLTILNEWKQRFPNEDPIKLYERFFHVKLIDPAGGQYVWSDKWQTMQSTIYGCPEEPKEGPPGVGALKGLIRANLGVTFENDGLRARTEVDREGK